MPPPATWHVGCPPQRAPPRTPLSPPADELYALLHIPTSATAEDAKRAWRALALEWHPDRYPGDPEIRAKAEDKFKRINGAYDIIADYLRIHPPRPAAAFAPEASGEAAEGSRTVVLEGVGVEARETQHSLGLRVGAGRFAEVVPKGMAVPCAVSKTFTNARDYQSGLTIHLARAADEPLGRVRFVDLPPGPRGFVRMEVVFAVDEGGKVAVGATDLLSGEPILAAAA